MNVTIPDSYFSEYNHNHDVANGRFSSGAPAFMAKDILLAQRMGVNVNYAQPMKKSHGGGVLSGAELYLAPRKGEQKDQQLTVLRHTLGHADKTPLGAGATKILGHEFSSQYVEEMRAWKNAVRNGNGRLDWAFVRKSLMASLPVQDAMNAMGIPIKGARTPHNVASSLVVGRHIGLLKRYARAVRHARS